MMKKAIDFRVSGLMFLKVLLLCLTFHSRASTDDPWDGFVPPLDDKYDWIQLVSGEWLKGELKVMYNHQLEFDSDELELLKFDFEDVVRLRTCRPLTVLVERPFGHKGTAIERGFLEISGDKLLVSGEDASIEVRRRKIVAIAPDKQRRRDLWSGKLSIGMNKRGGNAETADATFSANLKRRSAASRFNLDYLSTYSRSGGEKTTDNQRLSADFDWFLSARFYWQIVSAEYYRDPFSNIDGQYSLSSGPGYELIWTSKTEWLVVSGAGYQQQRFISVPAGENDTAYSPFFTFGTYFEQEVTKRIDFIADYSLRWLNRDNGRYTHHAVATLSVELISDFDIDFSLVWDRTEEPQPAEDGTLPEQDDYQTIVGIAYAF